MESCWIEAMQEELNEFERLEVWELLPRPYHVMIITLKWAYKVKLDELGDPENPNHVYKLKKALYGLKQALRAWYELLSSFLISQKFSKGTIDPTLFIKREGKDILLMSMMGKLSFFLGLQISQSPRGIFLNQSKYAIESLKNMYSKNSCIALTTFVDADHAGYQDTRRSTFDITTRDEKWVPTKERVKISTTNVRLETTVLQKEQTFQVIIDVIKISTCYKAFTISAELPKIFMQQFWYTVKKVKGTNSYEFHLANKKCLVDAEVFRKILDICPRVQGEEFLEVLDDDSTLTFLIDLGYKGPLYKYSSMSVDHMHQPWGTLAAIINNCLSGKSASNDRLRKSKSDIL
ncbi:retrovirus-related pol polyprotein from transposon TNT 1-94 [Tanacetum coccineum]